MLKLRTRINRRQHLRD